MESYTTSPDVGTLWQTPPLDVVAEKKGFETARCIRMSRRFSISVFHLCVAQ